MSDSRERELHKIVGLINDEGFDKPHRLHAETHANLIQLVQAWQQAQGASRTRFEQENDAPLPTLLKMKLPPGAPNLREIEKRSRPCLMPSGTGVHLHVQYVGEKGKAWTAWDFASQTFVDLLTHPERDKIAGPCARCGKYYIKKRASQKKYCSRICGNAATAVARTKEKWDKARSAKLQRAQAAMVKWSRSTTQESFQRWAEKHYRGLTQRFLTRAINNEELPEPIRRS
jgi:hypothetical protein